MLRCGFLTISKPLSGNWNASRSLAHALRWSVFPTCIAVPQFPKHLLFYIVDDDAVIVVRVGNTRRDWSELLGGLDPLP